MKKLEDYINFDLHDIPEVCNYIAVDDDGEVWAYANLPEYKDDYYTNGDIHPYLLYLGVLLTEHQVKELEARVIKIPKVSKIELTSKLTNLTYGEKHTLHTILNTLPEYYREYILSVLQSMNSTIDSLTIELEDGRNTCARLSKELKLIAQELE